MGNKDYNLEDEVLRLVKRYRSEISNGKYMPQDNAISVNTAKKRIIEKLRNGDIPEYVAGRALNIIVGLEKYYKPGSDMSLQDMFNESYKAKIKMHSSGPFVKNLTVEEKMAVEGVALQEYIRERRIAYYEDGDKEKRILYSMYDILEIDNDCVQKYDEFVRKYCYVKNKFVIDESLNDFIVDNRAVGIDGQNVDAPGLTKLDVSKDNVLYLKNEDNESEII